MRNPGTLRENTLRKNTLCWTGRGPTTIHINWHPRSDNRQPLYIAVMVSGAGGYEGLEQTAGSAEQEGGGGERTQGEAHIISPQC